MHGLDSTNDLSSLRKFTVLSLLIWTFLIAGSLVWNIFTENQHLTDMLVDKARTLLRKDIAFRVWATKHGGVYVPANDRTPPNPFLGHVPERDIVTPSGRLLTLMNPAYMMRQLNEESADGLISGRITSLKVLRPQNAPDEWERSALMAFERGEKEVIEISDIGGLPHIRMMLPILIEDKGCLKCHGFQGYKVGDVRGGVSTSVSMAPYLSISRRERNVLILSHLFFWLLGLGAIGFAANRGRERIAERRRMEQDLRRSEEKFRNFVETTNDWVWEVNEAGVYTYSSPAVRYLLGYTPEEVVGRTPMDFMPDPEARRIAAILNTLIAEQRPITYLENIDRHKDGHLVFLETCGVPFFESEGKFRGYRGG